MSIQAKSSGRGLVLLLVSVWLLAGCSMLAEPDTSPKRYTLGQTVTAKPANTAARTRFPITLNLRPVTAPGWLDSRRMLYRLAYTQDQALSAYTRSAWADPPAELVAGKLRSALVASHLFAAVLRQSSGQARLVLQLELTDFSQHFASADNSQGRIAATATLTDTQSGQVIAQHDFTATAPASSADAKGGVQALTRATRQLNTAIADWLATTIQPRADKYQSRDASGEQS